MGLSASDGEGGERESSVQRRSREEGGKAICFSHTLYRSSLSPSHSCSFTSSLLFPQFVGTTTSLAAKSNSARGEGEQEGESMEAEETREAEAAAAAVAASAKKEADE